VPVSACGLLALYRKTFCVLLIVASVQTLTAKHPGSHVMPLAAAEICGALLLLGRRTQTPGLALLLLSFAGAQLLAGLQGEWPTRFAQYALSALLIVLLDHAFAGARATPAAAADKGLRAR
jgi:hypothetical protein